MRSRDERPSSARGRVGQAVTLLAYMAIIFALSHQSRPPVPEVLLRLSDKVLHAAEYLPLGLLLLGALGRKSAAAAFLAWGAATLFGATDEFHQSFVPGRDASVWDLAADAAGAALGICALTAWRRWRSRQRSRNLPLAADPR